MVNIFPKLLDSLYPNVSWDLEISNFSFTLFYVLSKGTPRTSLLALLFLLGRTSTSE